MARRGAIADYARFWGSTPEERQLDFVCDRHLPDPGDVYYRAIDVDAPAHVLFRWLCQLRVAPYSYDLIDNRGRRSPRTLTPGLEQLAVGQRFMTIFDLVEFEQGRHLTLAVRHWTKMFGPCAVTYMVRERGADRSRLMVKLALGHRGAGSRQALRRRLMPYLEVVMMRKQLLTLRRLAERSAPGPPQ